MRVNNIKLPGRGVLIASIMALSLSSSGQTTSMNKKIIQEGFSRWASGTGSFFDLLSEDMQWTIAGSSPFSKTYKGKKQFMEEVIIPLNMKLAKKIIPDVRSLHAEDDVVIALWDGTATAIDDKPYNMSYAWFMQMKDGKIISVVAFLDGIAFTDIMTRPL